MRNVEEIQKVVNNSTANLIGKLMSPELTGIEITRDDLLALWVGECGLNPNYINKGVQNRTAVLRAMDELEVSGFTRKIIEEKEKAVWVLVNEQVDKAAEEVTFSREDKLTYDKKTGRLIVDRIHFQPTVDMLVEKYKYMYTSVDVSRFIFRLMVDEGSICMKKHSGFYFAPAAKFGFVTQLAKLIELLGKRFPGCHLITLDIAQGVASAGEVLRAYQTETTSDIKELLNRVKETAAEKTRSNNKSRALRAEEFKILEGRIALYTEGLNGQSESISKMMEELRGEVRRLF